MCAPRSPLTAMQPALRDNRLPHVAPAPAAVLCALHYYWEFLFLLPQKENKSQTVTGKQKLRRLLEQRFEAPNTRGQVCVAFDPTEKKRLMPPKKKNTRLNALMETQRDEEGGDLNRLWRTRHQTTPDDAESRRR